MNNQHINERNEYHIFTKREASELLGRILILEKQVKELHEENASLSNDKLTINEYCARERISRSTFYREKRAGNIKYTQIGKGKRIRIINSE